MLTCNTSIVRENIYACEAMSLNYCRLRPAPCPVKEHRGWSVNKKALVH